MPTIAEVREQYPQYNDMSDTALADALYGKYYTDMPRSEFNKKIGIAVEPEKQGTLGKIGSAIAERFKNPPDEVSLIGMAGRAYKTLTDPVPEYGDREAMTKRGLDIALTAGPISAGSSLRRLPVSPVAPEAAVPTVKELKTAARAGYKSPEVKELAITPESLQQTVRDLSAKLVDEGFDDVTAKKTWQTLAKAENAPPGAIVTGQNLHSLHKTLGNIAKEIDPVSRSATPDAAAAMTALKHIDEFIPNIAAADVRAGDPTKASATLKEAARNWSAAKHAELLDKKQFRAEMRAAAANSGQNVSNTIRQRMADVLINEKERMGFSQGELELMKRVVEGSGTQNAIRTAGNIMGGGGGVAAGGYGVAGALSNPAFLAVPVIGWGLKKLSNSLAIKDVEKLNALVRSNSPLGKQMAKPLEDWSAKAQAFEASPTVQNFARLSGAARNLATNMRDVGITVQPTDLVRSTRSEPEEETSPP